jgi:acyl dehydratase
LVVKSGWRGRFYEDFEIGDVYKHPLGRTITETDNIWFTLLTMNTNPMHFDREYAKKSQFKRCLINSGLTLAIVLGLSVGDLTQNAVANLGWDEVRMPAPLFDGDTLYAESEVLSKRESKSHPEGGIVTVKTRGHNQKGQTVIEYKRTFMVYKRLHSPYKER